MPAPPRIVIATQLIERNLPVARLKEICAEFGHVTIIGVQPGVSDGSYERVLLQREWFWRGLRWMVRKAGVILPRRLREKWVDGFAEHLLGVFHLGASLKRTWHRLGLKADLVVIDGAEYSRTAGRLARKAGAVLVYNVHEMFANERADYTKLLSACYCRYERDLCLTASHVIVHHHLWGKLLRRRYGITKEKFREVTPSPVPLEPLPGSAPGDPLRLYYHGCIVSGRGLEVLIQAVGLVPGVLLDIRGPGDQNEYFRRIAADAGAADRIRFLPAIPTAELPASGREYDLGVMPGTRAHLNGRMIAAIKIYENIAAGIPLFGFGAITVRALIREYGIGFSYNGASGETIAAALRECVANRGMVATARRRTVEAGQIYFNSRHQFARLREVICEALQGVRPISNS